jgi:hypothetical protein
MLIALVAVMTVCACDSRRSEAQRELERLVEPLTAYEQNAAIRAICVVTLDRLAHPENTGDPIEYAAGVARNGYQGGPRAGYAVAHMLAIYSNPGAAKANETAWNEDSCPTSPELRGAKPKAGAIGELFGKVVALARTGMQPRRIAPA